jgi:lipopolysaccharide/colanic/teichoic acid biosynthesis glycosyltransferase
VKVLYYHQHFTTPSGSGGTRSYEVARRLVQGGHAVTIVCGGGGATGLKQPFSKGRREGIVEGIRVVEFDLPYSNRQSFAQRTWAFLYFVMASIGLALREDYDILFATSTPLTVAIPGIAAKLLRRKTFVFEVRDLWPELPREMGVIRNPAVLGAMGVLEWMAYRLADGLVGLSPGISKGLGRFGKRKDRIRTIPNGCDLNEFGPAGPQWRPDSVPAQQFLAIFSGAMGIANHVEAALDAATVLKKHGRQDISILLIGDGRKKDDLIERVRRDGLDNVVVHDAIPKTRLRELLRSADVGLQMLANVPAFYYGTSPNKFFDYLASGLPVIVNYPGWLAELVTGNDCGIAVPPEDPEAYARALMALADDRHKAGEFGARARHLGETQFSRDRLAAELINFLEEIWEERAAAWRARASRSIVKRTMDIAVAGTALVALSPVLVAVAVLVGLKHGFPILFVQERPGLRGKPFRIFKFRTMTNAVDAAGQLLPDEARQTAFGRWLRSSSLDELPELWNVLRGEMSLVGPRPLLTAYLPLYSERQAQRHAVRPGISGWSQVKGRNALSWDEKFELDAWYIENWSFWLDVRICFLTLWVVLGRKGISAEGHATMPAFRGNEGDKRR